jgi:hypothetical protein
LLLGFGPRAWFKEVFSISGFKRASSGVCLQALSDYEFVLVSPSLIPIVNIHHRDYQLVSMAWRPFFWNPETEYLAALLYITISTHNTYQHQECFSDNWRQHNLRFVPHTLQLGGSCRGMAFVACLWGPREDLREEHESQGRGAPPAP